MNVSTGVSVSGDRNVTVPMGVSIPESDETKVMVSTGVNTPGPEEKKRVLSSGVSPSESDKRSDVDISGSGETKVSVATVVTAPGSDETKVIVSTGVVVPDPVEENVTVATGVMVPGWVDKNVAVSRLREDSVLVAEAAAIEAVAAAGTGRFASDVELAVSEVVLKPQGTDANIVDCPTMDSAVHQSCVTCDITEPTPGAAGRPLPRAETKDSASGAAMEIDPNGAESAERPPVGMSCGSPICPGNDKDNDSIGLKAGPRIPPSDVVEAPSAGVS